MTNSVLKLLIRQLANTHPNPKEAFIKAIDLMPNSAEEIKRIANALNVKLSN